MGLHHEWLHPFSRLKIDIRLSHRKDYLVCAVPVGVSNGCGVCEVVPGKVDIQWGTGHPYVFVREVHLVVSVRACAARSLCTFAYIDAFLLYSGTFGKVPCRWRWCGSASNLQYSPE